MAKKFENICVSIFTIQVIIASIFVGIVIAGISNENSLKEFKNNDNIEIFSGTIEEIEYVLGGGISKSDLYVTINNKVLDLADYITNDLFEEENRMEAIYYFINVGDNISIYETHKIIINGELYQAGFFENFSMCYLVISIIIGALCALLMIFETIASSGEKYSLLEYRISDRDNTIKKLRKDIENLTKFQEAEKKIQVNYDTIKYCNNCGSELDREELYCGYCGSGVKTL